MAYIESFFYFVLVILVAFIGLYLAVIMMYWIFSQFRFLYKMENPFDKEKQKRLIEGFIKHKLFKLSVVLYFVASLSFYVNQSFNYYGKDRAYPKAKAYAITANTVWFWQSMLLNVKINRGWGEFNRLLRPEDMLDTQVQKVQTFLLNRMYRYIPKEDGERDYWYYKYKQYYKAQIRYLPDSVHQPSEKIIEIMDDMHKTSHALYKKPIKDRVIDRERYLPIAQMSYYLVSNEGYFTPFERISYLDRLFKFMENKELFQKSIRYNTLLNNVYMKIKTSKEVERVFDRHPYLKGLFYAALIKNINHNIVYDTHNGADICGNEKMKRLVEVIQDFYAWVFIEKDSSFKKLSQREKRQILWLYGTTINFSYQLSKYVCKIPYIYKDEKNLPEYKNEWEFFSKAVTVKDFVKFTNTKKLLKR